MMGVLDYLTENNQITKRGETGAASPASGCQGCGLGKKDGVERGPFLARPIRATFQELAASCMERLHNQECRDSAHVDYLEGRDSVQFAARYMIRYKTLVRLLKERELSGIEEVVCGAKLDDSTATRGHDGVAGSALDKRRLNR
jgi:hypothetical protein